MDNDNGPTARQTTSQKGLRKRRGTGDGACSPGATETRKSKLPGMSYLIAAAGSCVTSVCYVITAPS